MALTPSTMLPLGTLAPDFHLLDTSTDKELSLDELKSNIATVIMFICNHCPYVKLIQDKLAETARHYQSKGISFIAISSNDIETYPQDGPEEMKKEAVLHHYPFSYLYDQNQQAALDYQAACTPDFYIFDKDMLCIYRGRFDAATPGNGQPVTGKDLCAALDAVIDGKPVDSQQLPSHGCNIKWRKK
jgi:thiol-disulfide isomerase/thioredoxin